LWLPSPTIVVMHVQVSGGASARAAIGVARHVIKSRAREISVSFNLSSFQLPRAQWDRTVGSDDSTRTGGNYFETLKENFPRTSRCGSLPSAPLRSAELPRDEPGEKREDGRKLVRAPRWIEPAATAISPAA